jgi:hypothetical protein
MGGDHRHSSSNEATKSQRIIKGNIRYFWLCGLSGQILIENRPVDINGRDLKRNVHSSSSMASSSPSILSSLSGI